MLGEPLSMLVPQVVGFKLGGRLREGATATDLVLTVTQILRQVGVPENRQRIFQSHAAAVEEAKRGKGLALAVSFAVSQDLVGGDLVRIQSPALQVNGAWSIITLTGQHASPEAAELTRFITTPRATQAMLRGSGVTVGRFKPSIHVTLWS